MTDQEVTIMELKVDIQCPCCYKKIKKILCKFPQIRDQKYDEKQNTVTITVVCCNPEKIRAKLCCKGGKTIKSIEIKPPPSPKKEPTKTPEEGGKPPEPKQKPPAPSSVRCYPPVCCGPCSEGNIGGPCYQDHGWPTCCGPCSQGVPGGPCYQRPRMPVPWYDNYGYIPYGVCGGRVYYTGRCDYFCEENPPGCRIM